MRWIVGDTTSGEGKEAQVHILVKPIGADLTTNLVITTDRRTYHLEMRSSSSTYMASVSWTYPASQLLALKKQRADADIAAAAVADTGVNIEQLKFRYRIEGDAPWKPRQVFDDGVKVYILFPSGLAQSEALMRGKTKEEAEQELFAAGVAPARIAALAPHKVFPGDRPSNTLVYPLLDPRITYRRA